MSAEQGIVLALTTPLLPFGRWTWATVPQRVDSTTPCTLRSFPRLTRGGASQCAPPAQWTRKIRSARGYPRTWWDNPIEKCGLVETTGGSVGAHRRLPKEMAHAFAHRDQEGSRGGAPRPDRGRGRAPGGNRRRCPRRRTTEPAPMRLTFADRRGGAVRYRSTPRSTSRARFPGPASRRGRSLPDARRGGGCPGRLRPQRRRP